MLHLYGGLDFIRTRSADLDKMKNFLRTQNLKQKFSAEKENERKKNYFQISIINKNIATENTLKY